MQQKMAERAKPIFNKIIYFWSGFVFFFLVFNFIAVVPFSSSMFIVRGESSFGSHAHTTTNKKTCTIHRTAAAASSIDFTFDWAVSSEQLKNKQKDSNFFY